MDQDTPKKTKTEVEIEGELNVLLQTARQHAVLFEASSEVALEKLGKKIADETLQSKITDKEIQGDVREGIKGIGDAIAAFADSQK